MKRVNLVCDTSLFLYLGRIGQAKLLAHLFDAVFTPEQVVLELDMGRLLRADTLNPRLFEWIKVTPVAQPMIDLLPPNRLGAGERAVIAFAQAQSSIVVGIDDRQAR